MGFDNVHIFNGNINGVNIYKFKQLDYKINKVEDRINFINDLMVDSRDDRGLNFFENYIDKHYKDKLSGNDELSTEHDVFKTLESMANYILGSDEGRELRKNDKQKYKFYMDENEFRLRTQKEQLFENVANDNDIKTENVIHFLLNTKSENYRLSSNVSVTKKDISNDDYCGQILREYDTLLQHINKEIKNPTQNGKRYILTKTKRNILNDMLTTKTYFKGLIKFKHMSKDSCVIDWDCFDWTNRNHIRELIYVQKEFNPENDLSFILVDLDNLLKKMKFKGHFTKAEKKVLNLIRQGYKNNEIADELKVRRTYVSNTISNVVKKICDYASLLNW